MSIAKELSTNRLNRALTRVLLTSETPASFPKQRPHGFFAKNFGAKILRTMRYQRMCARGTPKVRKRLQHEKPRSYRYTEAHRIVTPKEAKIFRRMSYIEL